MFLEVLDFHPWYSSPSLSGHELWEQDERVTPTPADRQTRPESTQHETETEAETV